MKLVKTKIAIIGLGLIGGSLGLLLKKKTNCLLTGFSLHRETLKKAKAIGAIDKIASSPQEAVKEAEIIFIATPILVVKEILGKVAQFLKPGSIVADVSSVKEEIVQEAEKILPKGVFFVGSHPMAGKEERGIKAAKADLLESCVWVLTPTKNTPQKALRKLKKIIEKLGAKPMVCHPKWHDQAVAYISHLPAVLASSLCLVAGGQKDWSKIQLLAAEGFRDTSRLAANPPLLHTDFCFGNKENLKKLIQKTIGQLEKFQEMLEKEERKKVYRFFQKAQKIRKEWFEKSRFAL